MTVVNLSQPVTPPKATHAMDTPIERKRLSLPTRLIAAGAVLLVAASAAVWKST